MFQGPDETAHLAMVAQVDRNNFGHYHDNSATTWLDFENSFFYKGDYYQQANVMAQYDNIPKYAANGVWGIGEQERLHRSNFDDTPGVDHYRHNTYPYPPVYYAVIAWGLKVYRQLFSAKVVEYQFLARMLSFCFYWAFVWAMICLAREILPQRAAVLSVALVLCLPALIFLPTAVNNDTGILAFTSVLALSAVHIIKNSGARWYLWAGISGLLLCFTKTHGVATAMVLFSLTAVALWLQAERRRSIGVLCMMLIPLVCHLVSTPLFGKFVLTGTPDPLTRLQYIAGFSRMFFNRFLPNTFGEFAWFEITYPLFVYRLFQIFFFGACAISLFVIGRKLYLKLSQFKFRTIHPLFAGEEVNALCIGVLLMSFFLFWALLFVYQWKIVHQVGIAAQGRYAIALFPFLIMALVWSFQEQSWNKIGNQILAAVAGFWFICSYVGLGMVIRRFFWDNSIETWTQIYDRILQYKPAYFKDPVVHWGILVIHLIALMVLASGVLKFKEGLKYRALDQG